MSDKKLNLILEKLVDLDNKISAIDKRLSLVESKNSSGSSSITSSVTSALTVAENKQIAIISEKSIRDVLKKELYPKLNTFAQYVKYKTGDENEILFDYRNETMGVKQNNGQQKNNGPQMLFTEDD